MATQDTAGKKPKTTSIQRVFERLESELRGASGRRDEDEETKNVNTITHVQRAILWEVDRTVECPDVLVGQRSISYERRERQGLDIA